MIILQKIGLAIASVGLMVGGWFGYQPEPPSPNLGASTQSSDVLALFTTTIASRITDTATSLTLTSATDKDGNTVASSTYGMIIDEGTASEELILADCTGTTCTNLTRGLSVRTGTTSVSALRFEHRRGAEIKITDAPALIFATNVFRGRQNIENLLTYNSQLSFATSSEQLASTRFVGGAANTASTSALAVVTNGITITGTTTLNKGALVTTPYRCTTASDGNQLCEKTYIDGVAVAGASNANETTKGIVEQATPQEINDNATNGTTGARLFISPNYLAQSTYASSSISTYSTTTTQVLATTTISGLGTFDHFRLSYYASSTSANTGFQVIFNGDFATKYGFNNVVNGLAGVGGLQKNIILIDRSGSVTGPQYLEMDISNLVAFKMGTFLATDAINTTFNPVDVVNGSFTWATTTRITSISIAPQNYGVTVGSGSYIRVLAY